MVKWGRFLTRVFVVCVVLSFCVLPVWSQTIVTWTGGSGTSSYNVPGNWDSGVVPINDGTNTYIVVIPSGVVVDFDVPGGSNEVWQLSLGSGSDLTIDSGRTLGVQDSASIEGTLTGDGGVFGGVSPACQCPGGQARLSAVNGASLSLYASSFSTESLSGNATIINCEGSTVDLSSLQSITVGNVTYKRTKTVQSLSSGTIDLSGLTTINGSTGDDVLRFYTHSGG